jgi:hypothetical protein
MLYLSIIFISAFLLFQIQPIISKMILPWFGGGASVWTACMLFFQTFLLLGYCYAHLLTQLAKIRHQIILHGALLLTSLIFLPVSTKALSSASVVDVPQFEIAIILSLSVGLPYFLLASTGPLLQRWLSFNQDYRKTGKLPYSLYSLSNVGSMLGLISYPFLVEPQLSLDNQSWYWSAGYMVFVLSSALLCRQMAGSQVEYATAVQSSAAQAGSTIWNKLLWLVLSATGVILLISTTNAMTQNIPPTPFLWILPLCIYLLTFIISFNDNRWYVRWHWILLFSVSLFAALMMFFIGSQFALVLQIVMYSLILLSSCMICHGELARLKPDVHELTLFYLYISLGGFIGGVFVSIIAQQIFNQFFEFPLALYLVYLLFGICVLRDTSSGLPKTNKQYQGVQQLSFADIMIARKWPLAWLLGGFLLPLAFYSLHGIFDQYSIANSRNFYGSLSVKDVMVNGQAQRRLIDGSTSHGTQSLSEHQAKTPMSYYHINTGIGSAIGYLQNQGKLKMGVIGLGAGTMAAYGRPGDEFHFYELNPAVETMARDYFSYLKSSEATNKVTLGDGRISLSKQLAATGSNNFQLLVVDAFSSDSIPTHLLTQEAFNLYWQHLTEEGVLAVHISNSHLDLAPLLQGLASAIDKQALWFKTAADRQGNNGAQWVLLTNNADLLDNTKIRQKSSPWPLSDGEPLVWTDNFSNLFSVLKL